MGDCLKDPGCSIQYLHRGKTGGTFVESQMFTMLGTKNEASCCQRPVVERFLKNRDYKCTLPFIAYQVKTAAFRDVILKECQKVFARKAQSSGARQRMVVLVTYREPVAKTISYVHQVCNKNLRGRSRSVQNICRRCNYHADPDHYRSMGSRICRRHSWSIATSPLGSCDHSSFIDSRGLAAEPRRTRLTNS